MNKALTDQNVILQKIAAALGGQASASQQAKEAQEQATEQTNQRTNAERELTEAMQENTGGSEGLTAALGRQGEATAGLTDSTGGFLDILGDGVTAAGVFTAAINGMGNAMDFIGGTFDLFKGGLTGILGIMGSGVKTVMGFFDGLFEAANNYGNAAAGEMFAANQAIIKQFGNLDATQGKFVKSLTDDLVPANNALKGANNSLWASIGNSAAILKEMTAIAGDFGNDLVFLQDQIKGAANELLIMKKGMNLSAEAMKNLGSMAKSSGGTLQDSLTEGMVASAHLSKQFGVDVKIIGKGLSEMAGDMETFGHLSVKEMAAVATYSAKLGVEISALKGVMDKFDSFDSAAQSAGTLAEAFGMNIDAMAMMNAENPAERMDMLRQSLEDTGKSFDELSRHEKKLMAQTMGMDMKSLQNAMSVDVDEMGFDDFGDAAEEAAEKMTPEQAMQDVAKSIEKLSHALTKTTGGPLGKFIAGFMQVVDRSPEMRKILSDVYAFLNQFFLLGREVGQMFMTFVRTNDGLLKQLESLFDLERITAFKVEVMAAFQSFFDLLATDPKAAMEGLINDLMAAVTNWSGSTGEGMSGLGDILQEMIIGAIGLLHGLLPTLMTTLADYLVDFTEMLSNFLSGDNKTVSNVTNGIGGALMAAMEDIGAVWGDKLWPAISDLMGVLWEAASPYVYKVLMYGLGFIFTKALITAVASLAAGGLVKGLAGGFTSLLKKVFGKTQEDLAPENTPGSSEQSGFFEGIKEMFKQIGEIKYTDVLYAGVIMVTLAAFLAGSVVVFALGLREAAAVLETTSFEDIAKALISTIAGVLATIALVAATMLLPDEGSIMSAIGGLVLAALLATAGIVVFSGAFAYAAGFMKDVAWDDLAKVLIATTAGIIGTYAIAAAALGLGSALAGPQFPAMLGGLVLGATLFTAGVVVFALAIAIASEAMSNVEWNAFGKMLAGLGVVMVATLALVATGALLGNPMGLLAISLAALGLPAAAGLFTVGVAAFIGSMVILMGYISGLNLNRVEQALDIVGTIMKLTGEMIIMAAPYAKVIGFGKDLDKTEVAIGRIADMSGDMFMKFADIITVIEDLPIKDPKIFALKMSAIGNMLEATAKLAKLGIDAADMANSASLTGDQSSLDMMNSMSNFIQGTIDSVTFLVYIFAKMAKGFTESDLKGANAIASIIQAVASLASGLMGPMTEIIGQNNDNWLTDNSSAQISSLATGMTDIFTKLNESLPTLITGLQTALATITDPKSFEAQAKSLGVAFKAIATISKSVGELYVMAEGETKYFYSDSATSVLSDMFNMLTTVMSPGAAMDTMIKAMVTMLTTTKFPEATIAENFSKGVDATMGIIKSIIKLSEFYNPKRQRQMNDFGFAIKKWGDNSATDYWGPSDIIKQLVGEAKRISVAMKDLEIDLQEIALKPIMDDVLGAKGKRTFTIEPKGVNIQVNFHVTMGAEDLATQIVKGNQKNKKEGFFQLTSAAAGGELEGAAGAGT